MPRPILPTSVLLAVLAAAPAAGQSWELPPTLYSQRESDDPVAQLKEDLETGRKSLPGTNSKDFLRALLRELGVPEQSQILVFSKTSRQAHLISPASPRAIYFSDNLYVAWVPGGNIEIITHDSRLGPVFYDLSPPDEAAKPVIRRDNTCVVCHGTPLSNGHLGLVLRSLLTDDKGFPVGSAGFFDTTHATPIARRWGGWYVTGQHGELNHMGNKSVPPDSSAGSARPQPLSKVDMSRYLRPTSDIAALMVFDHQCRMYTVLNMASMSYRRARFLEDAMKSKKSPGSDPSGSMADRVARNQAGQILDYLLFRREAAIPGEGIDGMAAFKEAFQADAVRSGPKNQSLKDFRLYGRLFKNRCSYMIRSHAFRDLPAPVKSRVLRRLWQVLTNRDQGNEFAHLKSSERARILAILRESLPDLPAYWQRN